MRSTISVYVGIWSDEDLRNKVEFRGRKFKPYTIQLATGWVAAGCTSLYVSLRSILSGGMILSIWLDAICFDADSKGNLSLIEIPIFLIRSWMEEGQLVPIVDPKEWSLQVSQYMKSKAPIFVLYRKMTILSEL